VDVFFMVLGGLRKNSGSP